jgi:hypothetical protein
MTSTANKNFVIATTTLFRRVNPDEKVRGDLAVKAAAEAKSLGIPVIAVDGGSDNFYKRALKEEGVVFHSQEGKTMGGARREAIRHAVAAGYKAIAYTEIEKIKLIAEIPKFAGYILEGVTSMVIPARKDLSSYPESQRLSETLGNTFWHKLTGLKFDAWFGPRVFSPEIAEYFLSYQGEYGDNWDAVFIPVLRAMAAGESIASVPTNYVHAEAQTNIEEGTFEYLKKRLTQLSSLTAAIEIEWTRLKDGYASTRRARA